MEDSVRSNLLFGDDILFCSLYNTVYAVQHISNCVPTKERLECWGWGAITHRCCCRGMLGGLIIISSQHARETTTLSDGHHPTRTPESRLPAAMVGGFLFAVTIFWFGWTAEYKSVHWIVRTIAGTFLAASILLIFVSYINYLIDTYLMFAASTMAANMVARSACAAASPLFTQYMFDTLGVGGAGSLIGLVAVILVPILFVFWRYGKYIRQRLKFDPTNE